MEGRPAIFKIDGGRGPDADFAIEPVDHRIERNTQSDQRLMVEFEKHGFLDLAAQTYFGHPRYRERGIA